MEKNIFSSYYGSSELWGNNYPSVHLPVWPPLFCRLSTPYRGYRYYSIVDSIHWLPYISQKAMLHFLKGLQGHHWPTNGFFPDFYSTWSTENGHRFPLSTRWFCYVSQKAMINGIGPLRPDPFHNGPSTGPWSIIPIMEKNIFSPCNGSFQEIIFFLSICPSVHNALYTIFSVTRLRSKKWTYFSKMVFETSVSLYFPKSYRYTF